MSDHSELFHRPSIETPSEINPDGIERINKTSIGNFEASGLVTNEQVKDLLRELPLTHLENCRSIVYDPHPDPLRPDALGLFDGRTHEIHIHGPLERFENPENEMPAIIMHEVGHNVHANLAAERPDLAAEWSEINADSQETNEDDGFGFVSDYARTNEYEDFAESYSAYIFHPDKLQTADPDKYEFMKQEVFGGREYPIVEPFRVVLSGKIPRWDPEVLLGIHERRDATAGVPPPHTDHADAGAKSLSPQPPPPDVANTGAGATGEPDHPLTPSDNRSTSDGSKNKI